MNLYDNWRWQIQLWLSAQDDLKDAYAYADFFTLQDHSLGYHLYSRMLYVLLSSFHKVYELPLIKKEFDLKHFLAAAVWVKLPPEEAYNFFKDKQILTRPEFDKLDDFTRQSAFTAANISKRTLEKSLKPAIETAILEGWSLPTLKKNLDQVLTTNAHLENIYRTNIQSAYNHGHMEGIYSLKEPIPGYQFYAVVDDRTTDICSSRDGMIFKTAEVGDSGEIPPLHYRCRSTIIPIFADQIKGMGGYTGEPSPIPPLTGFGRFTPQLKYKAPVPVIPYIPVPTPTGIAPKGVTPTAFKELPEVNADMMHDIGLFEKYRTGTYGASGSSLPVESGAVYLQPEVAGGKLTRHYVKLKGEVHSVTLHYPDTEKKVFTMHTHPIQNTPSPQDVYSVLISNEDVSLVISDNYVMIIRKNISGKVYAQEGIVGQSKEFNKKIFEGVRDKWDALNDIQKASTPLVDVQFEALKDYGAEHNLYTLTKLKREEFGI